MECQKYYDCFFFSSSSEYPHLKFCFRHIFVTRRYGGLRPPTSSSCGGLVAFGHLEGPAGPPDPTPSHQVNSRGILGKCKKCQQIICLKPRISCLCHYNNPGPGLFVCAIVTILAQDFLSVLLQQSWSRIAYVCNVKNVTGEGGGKKGRGGKGRGGPGSVFYLDLLLIAVFDFFF